MHELAARQVLLVQAFDTANPPSPVWTDDDRQWATRLALQTAPVAQPGDGDTSADGRAATAGAESFIAERAGHALQRLGPREPQLAHWLQRPAWRRSWVVLAVLAGLALGVVTDSIGGSRRINLLAPPMAAVLAWNLVVYLLLVGHGLAALVGRPVRPGRLMRAVQQALRGGRRWPGRSASVATASVWPRFAGRWLQLGAGLALARASTVLHAAAAAVAAGLIGGLYLRGLVLDYRAGWESTFLSAGSAQALLSALLAPASALSGIGLPDPAAFAGLRVAAGDAAGAPAGPWIHLFALTLLIAVVLPRTLLAATSGLRAAWLAGHVALPLTEPYFAQLLRQRDGGGDRIAVLPYAATLLPQAVLSLRSLFARGLGGGVELRVTPTFAFGAEDQPRGAPWLPPGSTLAVALFNLSATPETEHHGRFVRRLADDAGAAVGLLLLVDEAGFVRRFGAAGPRLAQRRQAWRQLADAAALGIAFVNLDAQVADADADIDVDAAIQRALGGPPRGG